MTTKTTKRQLKRKLKEAYASTVFSHKFAYATIDKCSTSKNKGSGVLIEITAIGGRELINPILITDGLSDETIEYLKKDIKKSSDLIESFKLK